MPQMAPLMWLSLFFFFLLIYMIMLTMTFFIKPYEVMSSNPAFTSIPQKSWKL
uniref:ATP synthase F0 subunit 8 n=1 Tax=Trapezia bidentata TaxID=652874 RepID=UPI0028D15545|nr:ATP synthase F0 subunit 8 [Trapezia bidentata]WMQ53275.1 ATP synthase F0 subunit 8 [Trapezia bidentata]